MRILLLGGTGEARHLAERLGSRDDLSVILSYAGRTALGALPPVPIRTGGFGGVEGLLAYLRRKRIDLVMDATHPFAARMSENATIACARIEMPLSRFVRPPWRRVDGDRWIEVASFPEAAAALGSAPKRVLLTIGQGGVDAFAAAPQHDYLVRAIGAPDLTTLSTARALLDRPPYDEAAEFALMQRERIDILVTKNSGGAQTAGKLGAARRLGLPVVMIARPAAPAGVPEFDDAEAILRWIDARQAERGV